jgi:serine/threonine protein kinase
MSSLKGSYGYITFSPDGNKAIKRASMQDPNNLNEAIIAASILSKKRKRGLIAYDNVTLDHADNELCITMDRGNQTLETYIRETRYKDRMGNIERVFRDLVTGLHTLHESGFIHCDFKPANAVFMDGPSGNEIQIIDFGSSRHFKRTKSPKDIEIWCTYPFCPPEALKTSRVECPSILAPTIDAYSLGATLFYYIYKGYLYNCEMYWDRQDALEMHESGVIENTLKGLNCPHGCPQYIFDAMLGLLKRDYKARTTIADLYTKYCCDISVYEPIIMDPSNHGTPRAKRPEAIEFLYENIKQKDCFALAVNIMDRYESVKGAECSFGELLICRNLAVMVMYPDIEIRHAKKQKQMLNKILEALEYKVYVDTADCFIDGDNIDYEALKRALVDSGGLTMDAVLLYHLMV